MKEYPVEQDPDPGELVAPGVEGKVAGNCPVQGYGKADEYFFYFRARGNSWSFDLGTQPMDEDSYLPTAVIFSIGADYGEGFDASWMSKRVAKEIILDCIEEFRKVREND